MLSCIALTLPGDRVRFIGCNERHFERKMETDGDRFDEMVT
jgi:hypothetical protein